ncbi:MAG: hypothetical protein KatS3mg119_0470 [Rhodothalassiaceae bacterium]|nr:MAG: hypothetical protein KatS3mg119_0470 [Rhodothalassiaceae bacterium]
MTREDGAAANAAAVPASADPDGAGARRMAILDAAEEAFLARGFAGARVEAIARAAGVAKGTVYLYFPSKAALFVGVVERMVAPHFARLRLGAVTERHGSRDLLLGLLEGMLARMAEGRLPRILRLLIAESPRFPQLAQLYHDRVIRRGLDTVEAILARGAARGEWRIADPAATARIIVAPVLMHGIWQVVFAPVGRTAPSCRRLLAALQSLLDAGLAGGEAS